jgi:hypothetical protein
LRWEGADLVTGHLGNWELGGAYIARAAFRSTRSPVIWRTRCSTDISRARVNESA